jgi:hypothetical protein
LTLPAAEDQQRINEFSKLNIRMRAMEEKIGELKVRLFATKSLHPHPGSRCRKRRKLWTTSPRNWSSQTRMSLYCM